MNKKTLPTIWRYAIVMTLGVLLNWGGYSLSQALGLPLWLDIPGTVLAAVMLEPTAGLMVGFVNNFYLALFFEGANSILFFTVSAAVALLFGLLMRPHGELRWRRLPAAMAAAAVGASVVSTALTWWLDGGVSVNQWELLYSGWALQNGWPPVLATFFSTLLPKLCDVTASAAILVLLYALLPRSLRGPAKTQKE